MNQRILLRVSVLIAAIFMLPGQHNAQDKTVKFPVFKEGETRNGFKAVSLYLNDNDQPMGARFTHMQTGFILDLIQIESVPQAFIWVNTFPVSDMGEPHTQEHLLISKGNKGRSILTKTSMSLSEFNAYTSQLHTVYDFHTGAGEQVFYSVFEQFMEVLLNPDYTMEEVNREVRNWGVAETPDAKLKLEEKGTVYNEMMSAENDPFRKLFDTVGLMLYGSAHPMSFNAGGNPSGIRQLTAADIEKFHRANYRPDNMGAIISMPADADPDSVLAKMDQILKQFAKPANADPTFSKRKLPSPKPAPAGTAVIIDFPSENKEAAGNMFLSYPPNLELNTKEYLLLQAFLQVFAGDPTSNLYKIFVDSKTAKPGMRAQGVSYYLEPAPGHPVGIFLFGINAQDISKDNLILYRQRILAELKRVASFKDHSPELEAFNKRIGTSLKSFSREMAKFVNKPPKFGFRNTYDDWYNQLETLHKSIAFKKSLVFKPEFIAVRDMLKDGKNHWKTYLGKWDLLDVTPYAAMSKANPELLIENENSRKQRVAAELARLKELYKVPDDQEAIVKYKAYYDSNSVVLNNLDRDIIPSRFIENPPLTPDDQLNYQTKLLNGKIPLVHSIFKNMTSATTGLALDLHTIPEDHLVYLAMMPQFLTETGVIKNGKIISYEEMSQLLQQQINGITATLSGNPSNDRAELIIKGAGNNAKEAQLAVGWMTDVLTHPNWTIKNISRLVDITEQKLAELRIVMNQSEENWAFNPPLAYRVQTQPLQLATTSLLTLSHNVFRIKWMLKTAGSSSDSIALDRLLTEWSGAETDRNDLKKLLSAVMSEKIVPDSAGNNKKYAHSFDALPSSAKKTAKEIARDLQQLLNDIPDNSLGQDWVYLTKLIRHDLAQSPKKTLAELNVVRKLLLNENNARLFVISSAATEQELMPAIRKLLSVLDNKKIERKNYAANRLIDQRIMDRTQKNEAPVFVGLINPNSQTGVFLNSAPLITFQNTTREDLLKLLAAQLYAGSGKQSVFTKTIGAGLSYSTGMGVNPRSGQFMYYAEKTPELPQTLKFVIDEIKRAPVDSAVIDYVVSLSLSNFRGADDYESRGEAMAADLADSITPEIVTKFRKEILKLRSEPDLLKQIYNYKDVVYETVLPGYGIPSNQVKEGVFFVIGPEKQMAAYEAYLKSVNGKETNLFRIYPRDFWMAEKL